MKAPPQFLASFMQARRRSQALMRSLTSVDPANIPHLIMAVDATATFAAFSPLSLAALQQTQRSQRSQRSNQSQGSPGSQHKSPSLTSLPVEEAQAQHEDSLAAAEEADTVLDMDADFEPDAASEGRGFDLSWTTDSSSLIISPGSAADDDAEGPDDEDVAGVEAREGDEAERQEALFLSENEGGERHDSPDMFRSPVLEASPGSRRGGGGRVLLQSPNKVLFQSPFNLSDAMSPLRTLRSIVSPWGGTKSQMRAALNEGIISNLLRSRSSLVSVPLPSCPDLSQPSLAGQVLSASPTNPAAWVVLSSCSTSPVMHSVDGTCGRDERKNCAACESR